ncbi:MAG: PEP-CTERM sorting domain-containing protein [Planctomycetota bacterium]|nr:MAG: PEP-CTERM sorting domain-containing protein [Planctomycetota bacterium]
MRSFYRNLRSGRAALVAAALGFAVGTAAADVVGVHMEVIGTDGANTDQIEYWGVQTPEGNWTFSTNEEGILTDPTGTIEIGRVNPDFASIWTGNGNLDPGDMALHNQGSGFNYVEDPIANLNFAVQAGPAGSIFKITSALLTFPTITNGTGSASASYTVTDITGDGATLGGLDTITGGAYRAAYNGFADGGGTTFASYFAGGITAPVFGTANPTQNTGPTIIPSVSDISTIAHFSLTPFDLASGTTTFSVVPEPASVALLAVGLALIRRR